jgi:hypothetical protein
MGCCESRDAAVQEDKQKHKESLVLQTEHSAIEFHQDFSDSLAAKQKGLVKMDV